MLDLDFEHCTIREEGYSRVIGIDEVGRGCLAGPVMVGAYAAALDTPVVPGVRDSKKLTPRQRQHIFPQLAAGTYTVKSASNIEIDQLGIAKVIRQLIEGILLEFGQERNLFLIDGRFAHDFGVVTKQVIKGDDTYYAIAAASILAKVTRDKLMVELDAEFPGYGFAQHKGYATRAHRDALASLGPCALHRYSYAPVTSFATRSAANQLRLELAV